MLSALNRPTTSYLERSRIVVCLQYRAASLIFHILVFVTLTFDILLKRELETWSGHEVRSEVIFIGSVFEPLVKEEETSKIAVLRFVGGGQRRGGRQ